MRFCWKEAVEGKVHLAVHSITYVFFSLKMKVEGIYTIMMIDFYERVFLM